MNFDAVARLLGERYLSRSDALAIQQADGSYRPDRRKVLWGDLKAHLAGTVSIGHYLVAPDGHAKLFAYDIDLDKWGTWGEGPPCTRTECSKPHIPAHNVHPREVWAEGLEILQSGGEATDLFKVYRRQLRALAEGLAERATRVLEVPTAVAYSGSKGTHVYAYTGKEEAAEIRATALELLSGHTYHAVRGDNFWKHDGEFPHLTIEVFPKQDELAKDGLGNLMRLPLGRNLKGGDAFFIDPAPPLDEWVPFDPQVALTKGTALHGQAAGQGAGGK